MFLDHVLTKIHGLFVQEALGLIVMKSRGFFPNAYWYWIGAGALLGYVFLFNFFFTLALSLLDRNYLELNITL